MTERGRDGAAPSEIIGMDRLNAFTDGVYAIAITLLVLELGVPAADEDLVAALIGQSPEFLGYLLSFAFIGGSWLAHARTTRLMERADSAVAGLNLIVLLFVAILPFSTSLMVTHLSGSDVSLAVLLYGLNLLLASVTLSLLLVYLGRTPGLLAETLDEGVIAALVRSRWIAIGINVLALIVAMLAPLAAVALYVLMTGLLFLMPLVQLRRRGRRPTG